MRRKDRSALSIPAAVQRSTICPSRQRVTLRLVALAMEIIDSTGLDVVSVLARRPSMPRRATVNISSSPSRRLAAALGYFLSSCAARCLALRSPANCGGRGSRGSVVRTGFRRTCAAGALGLGQKDVEQFAVVGGDGPPAADPPLPMLGVGQERAQSTVEVAPSRVAEDQPVPGLDGAAAVDERPPGGCGLVLAVDEGLVLVGGERPLPQQSHR